MVSGQLFTSFNNVGPVTRVISIISHVAVYLWGEEKIIYRKFGLDYVVRSVCFMTVFKTFNTFGE